MIPNINEKTGIPYGYISANALDSEVVDSLMFGSQAVDLSYAEFYSEQMCQIFNAEVTDDNYVTIMSDEGYEEWLDEHYDGDWRQEISDQYEPCELCVEGVYEGVTYCSSWLGGALNFFILESPVTTDKARRASPCVPGAGILDTLDGSEFSYDVPGDWRWVDESNA